MDEKCIINPETDCLGLKRAEEIAMDVKVLDGKIDDFRNRIQDTHSRFGGRIGKLEAREEVREEQYKHFQEKLDGITSDMREFQKDSKNSISELQKEHKESMEELRKGNREILDAITPLKHKVEELEQLEEDVEEMKEKPMQTWENIKKQGIAWGIGLILVIIAVALGLGKYVGM